MREKKKWILFLGQGISLALLLTVSKACIPLFLVAGTFLIYKEKEIRKLFIYQNVISLIVFLPVAVLAGKGLYFLSFALTLVAVIAGGLINYDKGRDTFKVWVIAVAAFFTLGIVLVIAKPLLFSSLSVRFDYMKDALLLIFKKPLTGCGTGSYRILQYGVQTTGYNITYLHNGILQFMVENGLVFAGGFLIIICFALFGAVKNKNYYAFSAICLIIIHSLLDFDLSFGSILMLLGLWIGMVSQGCGKKLSGTVALIISVVTIVTGIYMTSEYFLRTGFEKAYLEKDYVGATEKALQLEKICRKDSGLKASLAALTNLSGGEREEAVSHIKEALAISPNDGELYKNYMVLTQKDGDILKKALAYIDMRPKQEETYVYVKQYINSSCEAGLISGEEQKEATDWVEKRRKEEGVVDRDQLLHDIVNN